MKRIKIDVPLPDLRMMIGAIKTNDGDYLPVDFITRVQKAFEILSPDHTSMIKLVNTKDPQDIRYINKSIKLDDIDKYLYYFETDQNLEVIYEADTKNDITIRDGRHTLSIIGCLENYESARLNTQKPKNFFTISTVDFIHIFIRPYLEIFTLRVREDGDVFIDNCDETFSMMISEKSDCDVISSDYDSRLFSGIAKVLEKDSIYISGMIKIYFDNCYPIFVVIPTPNFIIEFICAPKC